MKNDVETVDAANALLLLLLSFDGAVNHRVKHESSLQLEFSEVFDGNNRHFMVTKMLRLYSTERERNVYIIVIH